MQQLLYLQFVGPPSPRITYIRIQVFELGGPGTWHALLSLNTQESVNWCVYPFERRVGQIFLKLSMLGSYLSFCKMLLCIDVKN